jgi:dolichyl-phosphate-mannose-protein mannosyltransferase
MISTRARATPDSFPLVNGRHWTAIDTVLVAALTALAGGLRFSGITRPGAFVFDEFYASDACLYVFGPEGHCLTETEISVVHPPLGKWLIGVGIRLFGFTPGGWRLAPLVAGALSVALLYLLARRLLGSTLAASLAAGFLAFDFLHFVMSRTAMLDVFVVFFGLLSFLCLLYDRDRSVATRAVSRKLFHHRLLMRPWLLGAGMAGGAALASKWSGGYLLAAVALLAFMQGAARRREDAHRYRRVTREEGVLLLVVLVLVPTVVYVVSYAGRLDGTLLAWPWGDGSWTQAFLARQHLMYEHHTSSLFTHPYSSPAWSWTFIKRPVLFYFRDLGEGRYQEILALGNPLVWWSALLALAATTWRVLRRRRLQAPETVVVAGFAAGYVPWLLVTRQEAFLYYLLPAVPFLYLALGHVVAGISARYIRASAIGGLVVASIGMFSFFRPLLVGSTLTYAEWERRMFFSDCGPAVSGTQKEPVTRPIPPPPGWCWI